MYTLRFWFDDKHDEEFKEIEKVEYATITQTVSVTGDEIFAHKFPLDRDMHLFSEKTNYIVSHKGLKRIDIEKE